MNKYSHSDLKSVANLLSIRTVFEAESHEGRYLKITFEAHSKIVVTSF